MTLLSDRSEALFKITFADDKKEPLVLLMADFIDEKSPKAKGKRISTLEITKIEDITPEPEPEPEPEVIHEAQEQPEKEETTSIDIDGVTMTIEKPKDTQLNLF